MTSEELKRTPLYELHLHRGARMVPFAGYQMPIQYSGIVEEHLAVRQAAGLFDVSHMGEVYVSGPQALEFIQRLVTNDASSLYDGRAMYTVMCREDGGIIDDLLVYRFAADRYMLVINASNIEKDVAWIREQAKQHDVEIDDASDRTALIALQGPATPRILERLVLSPTIDSLKYYHFAPDATVAGREQLIVSRTGYTGEVGVEIYCSPEDAVELWSAMLEQGTDLGLIPAGLGARDTLRLEAGLPLYGNDLDESTNPIEAGLSWLVKPNKGEFIGRDALQQVIQNGPTRKLVGIVMDERGIPRAGYELLKGDEVVGHVTSGTQSPILQKGIALGYVRNDEDLTVPNAPILVAVRGKALAAHVAKPPFHKN